MTGTNHRTSTGFGKDHVPQKRRKGRQLKAHRHFQDTTQRVHPKLGGGKVGKGGGEWWCAKLQVERGVSETSQKETQGPEKTCGGVLMMWRFESNRQP